MEWFWFSIIGIASGIISGLGIGGGTILIPALVFIFGFSQKTAQNINLIYFIPTAAIAIVTHAKNGLIEKKIATRLAIYGAIGAVAGSFIAINISGELLKKLFGGFLLIMGVVEFRSRAE